MMFQLFEAFKKIFTINDSIKDSNEMLFKVWDEKIKGLIPVEVDPESDLVIFHMLMDWSRAPQQWCAENCEGRYVFGHFQVNGAVVFFQHEYEAMAFKLRWI